MKRKLYTAFDTETVGYISGVLGYFQELTVTVATLRIEKSHLEKRVRLLQQQLKNRDDTIIKYNLAPIND